MSVYFAYTIGAPEHIYYGKYFGPTVGETELLSIMYPVFQKCYSVSNPAEVTISVISSDLSSAFSDRDPIKYTLVYCSAPMRVYWNGNVV
jgi:hypothetical protein